MNHQKLTVCKDNKIVEAGYKLTLNEQRTVLACLAQVNSMEELLKTDEFELSAKDFAQLFDGSPKMRVILGLPDYFFRSATKL